MRFEDALGIILQHEGSEFTHHPEDPGGATRHGITLQTLKDWRGARPTTAEDVKALTVEDAAPIYHNWYWDRVHCDELLSGVDLIIFDSAVNQGTGRAAMFLQQAAGVRTDGIIGPKTLAAVENSDDPKELIREIAARRAVHYAGLNPVFHLGWYRRLMAVLDAALRA